MTLWILGYYTVGLYAMSWAFPYWPFFEKMVGAVVWPVAVVVAIVSAVREARRPPAPDMAFVAAMALVAIAAEEAARKLREKKREDWRWN